MATNGPNISPVIRYRDAAAALHWLERAFGFERLADYRDDEGKVVHAELRYGSGMVMIGEARDESLGPAPGSGWCYVVVEDVDAHHARAVESGAEIVYGLTDQDYGSRDYAALDPEGNHWSFGTYHPTLDPH
jgi:uncharacterized glyoxalase superfamily protein PhnB